MAIAHSKVTAQGQISVPSEVRRKLGIGPGSVLEWDEDGEQIATLIDILLSHQNLTLQDPDVVATALTRFRKKPSLGFSDCLVLEVSRKAGHVPVGTFDRDLGTLDGAERL